jgi:hypothetical protein
MLKSEKKTCPQNRLKKYKVSMQLNGLQVIVMVMYDPFAIPSASLPPWN